MDIRYSCNQRDFKRYTTEEVRDEMLITGLYKADEVVAVYSHVDRMVTLGCMPVHEEVSIDKGIDIWANFGTHYFLERREIGIFNIGDGAGTVTADGKEYHLNYKDCLYLTKGNQKVTFKSDDPAHPAKFYMVSAPAHCSYENKLITIEQAAKRGIPAAMNAAPMDEGVKDYPIGRLRYLIVNEIEGAALAGGNSFEETMDNLIAAYPGVGILLTLGSAGAWFHDGDRDIRMGCCKVEKVVDTTAAGNALLQQFLAADLVPSYDQPGYLQTSDVAFSCSGEASNFLSLLDDLADNYPSIQLQNFSITTRSFAAADGTSSSGSIYNVTLRVVLCDKGGVQP